MRRCRLGLMEFTVPVFETRARLGALGLREAMLEAGKILWGGVAHDKCGQQQLEQQRAAKAR